MSGIVRVYGVLQGLIVLRLLHTLHGHPKNARNPKPQTKRPSKLGASLLARSLKVLRKELPEDGSGRGTMGHFQASDCRITV